jgi:hypothetical protein
MTIDIDRLEQIVKRAVATGAAVVVVVLTPGTSTGTGAGTGAGTGTGTDAGNRPGTSATATATSRTTATASAVATVQPTPAAATAAATLGWGTPTRADEFDAGTGQWSIYDGPGHGGNGRRSPAAVAVRDGVLTITGDSSGTTAGMSWGHGRRYGRWEARVRAPAADPSYHPVLLLWPDAENGPEGGEIDFMEIGDPARQKVDVFLHHGPDDEQEHGQVQVDATRWHNWAVEWTPTSVTTFLDGRKWYGTTDRAVQPPGPMHLCIQLDWFPRGGPLPEDGSVQRSAMQVDWVREYGVTSDDGGR